MAMATATAMPTQSQSSVSWVALLITRVPRSRSLTFIAQMHRSQMQIRWMLQFVTHQPQPQPRPSRIDVQYVCTTRTSLVRRCICEQRKQSPPRSSPSLNSDRSDTPHGSRLDVAGIPCKVRAPAPRTLDSGMISSNKRGCSMFCLFAVFPRC